MTRIFKFLCFVALICCVALFVSCDDKKVSITEAKDYLFQLYKNSSSTEKNTTPSDYTLDKNVVIDGVSFNVNWALKEENLKNVEIVTEDGVQKVNIIDELSIVDEEYTLVALITWAGEPQKGEATSVTSEFERKYPAFVESSWDQFAAACESGSTSTITCKGYVLDIIETGSSSGSMYVVDATGHGYYCYKPTYQESYTEVTELSTLYPTGTEVFMQGTVTKYSGQYEFNKGVSIKKTGGADGQITPINATADFKAAANNKDAATLAKYQNTLVTIEDCVLMNVDGMYYYFALGKSTFNMYENTYFLAQAEIDNWKGNFQSGQAATITGLVSVYSEAYQIYAVSGDMISNLHAPTLTADEKLLLARSVVSIDEKIYANKTVTLPSVSDVSNDISITWSLIEESEFAAFDQANPYKLVYTYDGSAAHEVKLKATFSIEGADSISRSFKVQLCPPQQTTIAQFLELDPTSDSDVICAIKGWVVASGSTGEVDSLTKGSFEIADETGAIFSYSKFAVKVGDYVEVYGTRSVSYGVPQIATTALTVLDSTGLVNPYDKANAEVIDAETLDLSSLTAATITQYTGKLVKIANVIPVASGTYWNGHKVSTNTKVLAIYSGYNTDPTPYAGQQVYIYGYVRGFSTGNYLTVQVSEYEIFVPERTDAEKVAYEKELLTMPEQIQEEGEIDLQACGKTHNDVQIAWSLKEASNYASISEGKLNITLPEGFATITLVATITVGEETDTKEFEVSLEKIEYVTVAEFLAAEPGTKVYGIYGWVVATGTSLDTDGITEVKGSFEIADATGAVFSYNKEILHMGDYVCVYGTRSANSGVAQIGTVKVEAADSTGKVNPYDKANAEVWDCSTMDLSSFSADTIGQYTGKLYKFVNVKVVASGTYWNGNKGSGAAQVLSLYCGAQSDPTEFANKQVFIYAYVRGFKNGKYLTVQVAEFELPTYTDAEKVASEKEGLTMPESVEVAKEVNLAAAGAGFTEVAIAWEVVSGSEYATIAEGKVSFTMPTADTAEVKIKATLTCGEVTDTKEFTVVVGTAFKYTGAGTAENPYTVADIIHLTKDLASGTFAEGQYYVKGIVIAIGADVNNTWAKNVYIADSAEGEKFLAYNPNYSSTEGKFYVGDTITICGPIKNYNGTIEFTNNGTTYPMASSYVRATSAVTVVENANATVTGAPESAANGSSFTFTVAAATGYEIDKVKVNGSEVTAVEGVYTAVVAGATSIEVITKEAGKLDPVAYKSFAISGWGEKEMKNSSYDVTTANTYTITRDSIDVTLCGFSNNNQGWQYVKAGSKNGERAGCYIATGLVAGKVERVDVSFLAASNVTSAQLIVSKNADFSSPLETIDFTASCAKGVTSVTVATPTENCYYKVIFTISKASANGPVQIDNIALLKPAE